jgi:hypothetical protein
MYEPRKLFSSGLMSVADVESHFDSICRCTTVRLMMTALAPNRSGAAS